jgi:hypothetical protein
MGKIKEVIIELAEELHQLLIDTGYDDIRAEYRLHQSIPSWKWEFYLENKEFIWETIDSFNSDYLERTDESLDSEKGMNIPGPIVFAEMLED